MVRFRANIGEKPPVQDALFALAAKNFSTPTT